VPALHASERFAACFNGGHRPGDHMTITVYEGFSDWRSARASDAPSLVFQYPPGRNSATARDLPYCVYVPGEVRQPVTRCQGGWARVGHIEPFKSAAIDYRILLDDGQVKGRRLEAAYCPPSRRP
jgi:hypothetical protein